MDVNNIFSVSPQHFTALALDTHAFQYENNTVYREWCRLNGYIPGKDKTLTAIPALPISCFKSHTVVTTDFAPEMVFESSGTTQTVNSRHLVKDLSLYRRSFLDAFRMFYGDEKEWCILGLLPSYLERNNSSLVLMVDELIKKSGHPKGGFYLDEFEKLSGTIKTLEQQKQKTLLIGVTFALLDFAEAFPQELVHTVVMETGGMKGRKREMTRAEVHGLLTTGLGVKKIHSEYGMTELLSQAYSAGDGRFVCPPWMKVMVRDEEDPLAVSLAGTGLLTVIDLANQYSCAFIATEDVGKVYEDGSFEVWGRLDHSDIRGCSLLVL